MAALKRVYNHRYLILVWSVLEILLFSAIVYGWAALVVVLKQESFFHDLCENKHEVNSTSTSADDCIKQDERLNLVFLTGVISFSGSGLLSGAFLDRFGPRKTRLLSSFLFMLTFLFYVLADKDRPNLIFPGIFTLSAAGLTLLLTIFQVANMFDKWKSSVISLYNGSVDSSAIMLLVFKLVYDEGVPLRSINIFYYLFAIITILLFTFILPPYTITAERLDAINVNRSGNSKSSYESSAKDEVEGDLLVQFKRGHSSANTSSDVNGEMKTPEKNGKSQQETDIQSSPLCQSEAAQGDDEEIEDIDGKSSEGSSPGLLSQMMTAEYALVVAFLGICNLRLWFYVGNLNSYLEFMSDNDMDVVNHYTNWFGIIQFAGFFFAPVVGLVMDWKPKSKRNEKTDVGFVFGFLLTAFVALVMNIFVVMPTLSVQYVTFVVQVVLRAFAYAVYAAFLLHKFPLLHFGKLYGAGHLISAIFGSIQYALFIAVEDNLQKDPFWVNIAFIVLCFFLNVLPLYLWINERRQRRQIKNNERKNVK